MSTDLSPERKILDKPPATIGAGSIKTLVPLKMLRTSTNNLLPFVTTIMSSGGLGEPITAGAAIKPLPIAFSLLGHKERSFDVRFSSDGRHLLSGSQDGTARLWDVASRKCIATLKHSSDNEVLRCAFVNEPHGSHAHEEGGGQGATVEGKIIATGGADGVLKLWAAGGSGSQPSGGGAFQAVCDLDHGGEQIYACESFHASGGGNSPLRILSAAGSVLYVWDLGTGRALSERVSFQTAAPSGAGGAFGGPRNPENQTFIFDAKPCTDPALPGFGCVAAALSDGTVRFRDFRSPIDAMVAETNLHGAFASMVNTAECGSSSGSGSSNRLPSPPTTTAQLLASLRRACGGDGDAKTISISEEANTHPTSVHWSAFDAGGAVAASLSSGDVAILDVRMGVVRARFSGCHRSTCFGVTSTTSSAGGSGGAYVSWSSDGSIRIWREDFSTVGYYTTCSPTQRHAVFGIATTTTPTASTSTPQPSSYHHSLRIAIAGGSLGGQQNSFLGEPLLVADVCEDW